MAESAVYVLEKMSHGYQRGGRAAGRGFYDYQGAQREALWPGLSAFQRAGQAIADDEAIDRLLWAQALEAMRCLEAGIVASEADVDTASRIGWGVEADGRPGLAAFVSGRGLAAFCERADALAQRYGERFAVPAALRARTGSGHRH